MNHFVALSLGGCLLAALGGCDLLGIETPEKIAAVRDAEGRAVGGACRHAGRAIEDCYTLNRKADKAAVFAGWRDMNDYMRENKLEPVLPTIPSAALAKAAALSKAAADDQAMAEGKGAVDDKAVAAPASASASPSPSAPGGKQTGP